MKENCNLISINNIGDVDNKEMVWKEFGKVDLNGKNLVVFSVLFIND